MRFQLQLTLRFSPQTHIKKVVQLKVQNTLLYSKTKLLKLQCRFSVPDPHHSIASTLYSGGGWHLPVRGIYVYV